MAPQQSWQDYFYPGTNVLRNRFGITDPMELGFIERLVTSRRQSQLADNPARKDIAFTADHLQAIHYHLFQDVYDWAGEFRIHGLAKDGHVFASARTIQIYLDRAADLSKLPDWRALDHRQVTGYAGTLYAWVNHAHPFREGNGRAAREWLRQVVSQGMWYLDFHRVPGDLWAERSKESGPRSPRAGELPQAEHFEPRAQPIIDVFDRFRVIVDRDPGPTLLQQAASQLRAVAQSLPPPILSSNPPASLADRTKELLAMAESSLTATPIDLSIPSPVQASASHDRTAASP